MITVKKNSKAYNNYQVKANWTLGKIEAVKKALELYKDRSPVANDVYHEIIRAMDGVNTEL